MVKLNQSKHEKTNFPFLLWPLIIGAIVLTLMFANRSESVPAEQGGYPSPDDPDNYLPLIIHEQPPTPTFTPTATPTPTLTPTPEGGTMQEVRGLWVSRFDWTSSVSGAQQAKIDEIVDNAALAGINLIYFQVRGTADSFYTPGLEPWSQRMTGGNLGDNPGWDPLAVLIEKAHAQNIEVHAYLNIYPIWFTCDPPPDGTTPRHLYHQLADIHIDGASDFLQQSQWGTIYCSPSEYQRVSPASGAFDTHVLAVAADLNNRYDIDGIHLDHIRYGAAGASYDPLSKQAYELEKAEFPDRADWQRRQVNGTVNKFYTQILEDNPSLMLSAAVWPVYENLPSFPFEVGEGRNSYYQDSKEWVQQGYIDTISPMIYPATFNCPDNSFWSLQRWTDIVNDFHATRGNRAIVPGIGTGYCSFSEIENRINAARNIGTFGHALFSYRSLHQTENGKTYFQLLAEGPYAQPAVVPEMGWR